jgi:hypothetical protein
MWQVKCQKCLGLSHRRLTLQSALSMEQRRGKCVCLFEIMHTC